MNYIVLDTVTGKTYDTDSYFKCGMTESWWAQGNGSCDCNRCLCVPGLDELLEEEFGDGFCYGSRRLLLLPLNGSESDYEWLNDSYPRELVNKFKGFLNRN
jgi:hypothetical protein